MQTKKIFSSYRLVLIALCGIVISVSSCKKEYETIEQLDQKNIQSYKDANTNLHFTDTAGYSYAITNPGTGSTIKNSDSIYYSYKFKNLAGKILNETEDLMIPGTYLGYSDQYIINNTMYLLTPVREVFSKLKRGGKAVLLLPSRLAFGKNGLSRFGIESNETLVVELGIYNFSKKHEVDAYEMNTYISQNNLTLNSGPSGIKYQVITPGTGTDVISEFSTLTVTYTGRNLDGKIFDSGTGIVFRLDQLIKGWQIILPGKITEGGKMRVIIPSHLAYGAAPLDFDIEVTKVANN